MLLSYKKIWIAVVGQTRRKSPSLRLMFTKKVKNVCFVIMRMADTNAYGTKR